VLALRHADPIRAGFLNKKRVLKWFENIGYTIYVLTLVSHVSVAVSDIITLDTGRFRGSSVPLVTKPPQLFIPITTSFPSTWTSESSTGSKRAAVLVSL